MLDNIGAEGRARANHRRWHEKKQILKAGCGFCIALGAAEKPLEPVVRPLVIEKAPETAPPISTIPAGYQEDPLAEAKRERFKDDAWSYAANGLPGELTAKLMNCTRDRFESEIESLFHQSWDEVCALAQLSAVNDLQTAALRNAKRGDFRGIAMLEKSGLIPSLTFAKRYLGEEALELRKLTEEGLVTRFKKLTGRRGLDIERMMTQSETLQGERLIEVRDARPEELEEVMNGGVSTGEVGSSGSNGGASAGPAFVRTSVNPPAPNNLREVLVKKPVKEPVEQLPVRPSEALRLQPVGPVVCRTDQAWGLLPHERQYSR